MECCFHQWLIVEGNHLASLIFIHYCGNFMHLCKSIFLIEPPSHILHWFDYWSLILFSETIISETANYLILKIVFSESPKARNSPKIHVLEIFRLWIIYEYIAEVRYNRWRSVFCYLGGNVIVIQVFWVALSYSIDYSVKLSGKSSWRTFIEDLI